MAKVLIPDQYAALPWETLKLVTVILAHNETGTIQDLEPLAAECRRRGVPLHIDAVQAVGKIPVSFRESGASFMSVGAHKFHGPRGVGALVVSEDEDVSPMMLGGHQESGRRPGTEPVPLIVGMARALEAWNREPQVRMRKLSGLRDRLETGLRNRCAPVVVNGSLARRLPNTLNISFPGVDGEAFLIAIDMEGIACSLGSTCASGSTELAPVLLSMGCPPEVCASAVRFSVGIDNTVEEIDEAIRRIAGAVARLRRPADVVKGRGRFDDAS
jgi:cysteine desulfurase